MHVHVDLPGEDGIHGWPERHARGEVADALPYGLDKLARHGITTTFRTPLARPLARKLARKVRARLDHVDVVSTARDAVRPERRNADAIFCWNERSGLPAALVPGTPPVVWNPTWLLDPATVPKRVAAMVRWAIPRSAALFHFSDAMCATVERVWGMPEGSVHRARLGVDENYYRALPFPEDGHTVMTVGDDRRRDHEQLIRSMDAVVRSGVEARLEIITKRTQVQVPEHLGVVHHRRMEGAGFSVQARSSVVAIAVRKGGDGSGLTVMLEAMACARPVVVTDLPGMDEYVQDGVTGLLVPPGDDLALRDAIASLLKDPDAAAEMGRAGRRLVEERFTSTHMADDLAAVLRSVA